MQKTLLAVVSLLAMLLVGCPMTTTTNEEWFGSTFDTFKPQESRLVAVKNPAEKAKTFVRTSEKTVDKSTLTTSSGDLYIQKTDNLFLIVDASGSASERYDDGQHNFALKKDSRKPSKFEIEKELMRRMNDTIATIPDLKFTLSIRSFGYGNCYRGWGQTYLHVKPTDYSHAAFEEILLDKSVIKNLPKKDYERIQEGRLDCAHGRPRITDAIGTDKCDTDKSSVIDCTGTLTLTNPVTNPLFDKMGARNKGIQSRKNGSTRKDLENTKGNIAVVIFSDGNLKNSHWVTGTESQLAIEQLALKYHNRLCIYTVFTGTPDDEKAGGKQKLEQYANVTLPQCKSGFEPGFKPSVTAAEVSSAAGMENFVDNVFFKRIQPVVADCSTLDADGDGVNDCDDKCPDTLKGAHVNKYGCWFVDVKFDNDKSDIKPAFFAELNNAANVINNNPGLKFEIQGHTSSTGTPEHNMALSIRRANAVMDYLKTKVNNPDALTARGYGLTRPIDTNATEEGRANNRRVQLEVIQ
jgi:outer membrane protein OmpA-like peptidoglycan-associated protein